MGFAEALVGIGTAASYRSEAASCLRSVAWLSQTFRYASFILCRKALAALLPQIARNLKRIYIPFMPPLPLPVMWIW